MSASPKLIKVFSKQRDCLLSNETQALAIDTWSLLCDKNVVIASGFIYGMTWFGVRKTLRQPLSTMLFGALICAPIAAFGTEILCDLLPPKTLGVVPLFLGGSVIYSIFSD